MQPTSFISDLKSSAEAELRAAFDDNSKFKEKFDPLIIEIFQREDQKDLDKINAIGAKRRTIDDKERSLKRIGSLISKFSIETGDPLKLLELELKFKQLQSDILDLKIYIVSQLGPFTTGPREELNSLVYRYVEALTSGKEMLSKIEKVIQDTKKNLIAAAPNPNVAIQQARGEILGRGIETVNRIEGIKAHMQKSHAINISTPLLRPISELKEIESQIGKAQNLEELESLRKSYFLALEKVELEICKLIAPKQSDPFVSNMIREIGDNLAKNIKLRKAEETEQVDEVDNILEGIDVEMPLLQATPMVGIAAHEAWQYKPWGLVLTTHSSADSVLKLFSRSFVETVNFFEKEKISLKEQLAKMDPDHPERAIIEKKLAEIKRELYPILLQRMIDTISQKEWEMRVIKKIAYPSPVQLDQQAQLTKELQILNGKFYKAIEKYRLLPEPDKLSLASTLTDRAKDEFLRIATMGYYKPEKISHSAFMNQKRYADMGYSMTNYLKEWTSVAAAAGSDPVEVIKKELLNFVSWAGKHPKTATMLASDIALTVNLIGGESFAKTFEESLKSKAYTRAFFAPLGGPDWEAPEIEEELKFRALADLARFIPMASTATKNIAQELSSGNYNIVSLLVSAASGGVKATIIQSGNDIIPDEAASVVLAVTSIMRSEDIRKILEDQRNIELVRLGGMAQKLLFDPKEFTKSLGNRVKIWMRSFGKSKGNEKFLRIASQILVPAASVVAASTLIAIVALGGPITWAVALGMGVAILSFGFTFAWRTNSAINAWYPNTSKSISEEILKSSETKRLETEAKESARKALLTNNYENIEKAREGYISDLIAARQIPYIKPPEQEIKSEAVIKVKNRIKDDLKFTYMKAIENSSSKDPVEVMRTQFEVDEMISRINSSLTQALVEGQLNLGTLERNNLAGLIAYEIVSDVMNDWFRPRIDNILVERALERGGSLSMDQLKALAIPESEDDYQERTAGKINKFIARDLKKGEFAQEAAEAAKVSSEIWDQNLTSLTNREDALYKKDKMAAAA